MLLLRKDLSVLSQARRVSTKILLIRFPFDVHIESILARLFEELELPPTDRPKALYGLETLPRATLASHIINLQLIPQIINDYPASRAGDLITKIGNPQTACAKWPTLHQDLSSEGIKDRLLASISEDMHDEMIIVLEGIDEVCATWWGKAGLVKAGYAAMRAGPGEVVAASDDILGIKGVEMKKRCETELERLRVLEWEMRFGIWSEWRSDDKEEEDPIEWMVRQREERFKDIARISNRNHTVELVKKCMGEIDIDEKHGRFGDMRSVVEKVMEGKANGRIPFQRTLTAH
jgi:hypothetical protein